MGRRSLTSTKGGKFMNPTDQARKEARKKELKKNKKQRMAVRQAVLKGKDPQQIVEDLIKIDEMEFNVAAEPPLSEKVLTDKRRKLMETFDRIQTLYKKEDVERYHKMKNMFREYETRRTELVNYYHSVKQAEMVTPDEIPLPAPMDEVQDIPMPSATAPAPRSILKKHPSSFFSDMQTVQFGSRETSKAPGVPIGPPTELSDCSDDEEEAPPVQVVPKKIHATQLPINPAPAVPSSRDKHLRFAAQPTTAKDGVLEFLQQMEKPKEPPVAPVAAGPLQPPSMLPPSMVMQPPPLWNAFAPPAPPDYMMSGMGSRMSGQPMLPNKISAPPQKLATTGKTTIQAKPQMRSLQQEVVKLVPSQLRVKKPGDTSKSHQPIQKPKKDLIAPQPEAPKSKDDAYQEFMKSLQGYI